MTPASHWSGDIVSFILAASRLRGRRLQTWKNKRIRYYLNEKCHFKYPLEFQAALPKNKQTEVEGLWNIRISRLKRDSSSRNETSFAQCRREKTRQKQAGWPRFLRQRSHCLIPVVGPHIKALAGTRVTSGRVRRQITV